MLSDANQSDLEELREQAVSRELRNLLPDDKKDDVRRSTLYRRLLDGMTKSTLQHARENNINPPEFRDTFLYEAIDLISDLRFALSDEPLGVKEPNLNFWHFDRRPLHAIRSKKTPHIDRNSIEHCVGRYLQFPYRSQIIDRFLVEILVAIEMYAFGDEMFNEETFGIIPHRSPLKQRHIVWSYLRGVALSAIVLLGLAVGSLYLSISGVLGVGWAIGLATTFGGLFALDFLFRSINLPKAWMTQTKARKKVLVILDAMMNTYASLHSSGPISASHIRQRVEAAANAGVIWPTPLYVMLDDIDARTGRF